MVCVAEPPLGPVGAGGPGVHDLLDGLQSNRPGDGDDDEAQVLRRLGQAWETLGGLCERRERFGGQVARSCCLDAQVLVLFNDLEPAVVSDLRHITGRTAEDHAGASGRFEQPQPASSPAAQGFMAAWPLR
ncbi:hypothetical protein, partial [Streptomyces cadmiisoli]|uniref:hypothetical protein n=1 Tax=Streptomyces cadmiisoli TaxID=2184053 RepID=UPI00364959CC